MTVAVFVVLLALTFVVPGLAVTNVTIGWNSIFKGCRLLQGIATTYNQAHPDVNVQVECTFTFDTTGTAEYARVTPRYDIQMMQSSYVPLHVESGYVQEITDFMNSPSMKKTDFFPAALKYVSEHPPNSGKYWGVPLQAETQLLVYRADIYRKYNMTAPADLETLLQHAQFFKNQVGLKGGFANSWCSPPCDSASMLQLNEFLWMWGGDVWNENTYKIAGVLDSPASVAGLEYAKQLFDLGSANQTTGGNYIVDFCNGDVPIVLTFMSFVSSFQCSSFNLQPTDIGYYPLPYSSTTGLQQLQFGGFGMHLSARSTAAAKQASLDFMQYVTQPKQQLWWAANGLFSTRKSVVNNPNFLLDTTGKLVLYNAVFAQSFAYVKHSFRSRICDQLVNELSKQLMPALKGQITAKAALSSAAVSLQAMMDVAYPCGRVCIPQKTLHPALRGAVLALAITAELMYAAMIYGVIKFWFHHVIKAAAPTFVAISIFGAMFMMLEIFFHFSDSPTDGQCVAKTWAQTLGFAITFGAFFAKTYRIAVIFNQKTLSVVRISDLMLFRYFLAVVLGFVTFLSVWTALSPPGSKVTVLGGPALEDQQKYIACDISVLHFVNYALQLSVLCLGSVLAYRVRNAPSDFHEAKFIGIAIYNWAVVSVFVLIGLGSSVDYQSRFAIDSLAVLLTAPVALAVLVGPKFLAIYQDAAEHSPEDATKVDCSKIGQSTLDSRPGQPQRYGCSNHNTGNSNTNNIKQSESPVAVSHHSRVSRSSDMSKPRPTIMIPSVKQTEMPPTTVKEFSSVVAGELNAPDIPSTPSSPSPLLQRDQQLGVSECSQSTVRTKDIEQGLA